MKKQDLTTTGLLAHDGYYGADPVRLLDVQLWRLDSYSKSRVVKVAGDNFSRPSKMAFGTVGYPVLALYGQGAMGKTERAEAEKFLAETELTMADLIDQEGHDIPDVLPKGIRLRIVNNRKITGDYATVRAEIDAEDARVAAECRAAEAKYSDKAATVKATSDRLVEELDALGVNNMITMVSEHSVTVDVRTLEALIEQASALTCIGCGARNLVKIEKDADGHSVGICFKCRQDGVTGDPDGTAALRDAAIEDALGHALALADPEDDDCLVGHARDGGVQNREIREAVRSYVLTWIAEPLVTALGGGGKGALNIYRRSGSYPLGTSGRSRGKATRYVEQQAAANKR